MKLKNSSIFLFTIASLFGSSVLAAQLPTFDSSDITFSGRIYSPTCKITVSENGKIKLDNYFLSDFNGKGTYPQDKKTEFKLEVSDCDLPSSNSLYIKFEAEHDKIDTSLIAVDTNSVAEGVGIAIYDKNDKLVTLNDKTSNPINVVAGKVSLEYKAFLKQNSDMNVKAGDLTATAKVVVIAS